ncbi:MAG: HEAT repeat domain-containing protein [Acidobacteriaceae bacterium]
MKTARMPWQGSLLGCIGTGLVLLWLANPGGVVQAMAQDAAGRGQSAPPAATTGAVAGNQEQPAAVLPAATTPEERDRVAWKLLTDAAADPKSTQTRIQALAALGLLRCARAEKMITDAMAEPDLDVRTAAAQAAGLTKDRNLTTPLRNLLDDKEPEVAFSAAMTLWKMNDKSGEDILMAVVDGERSAGPTLINGTKHKISKDLHDPAMLAKLGALQGASMLLGPFGFGITAFEYIHQSGGDLARASAIEEIAQERTEPIHKELLAALGDKDQVVRAAAVKALADYHGKATQMAVYALLADSKQPIRLTAAAAYLRTTGVPGPPAVVAVKPANVKQ